jgi:hypothetical protein
MTTYDVPGKNEAEFLNRLDQFFKTVNRDNRNDKEKYDGLLALLREYKPVFESSDEVMKWFFRFHALELMDDWQEDLFGDLADHLTGFCPANRKIEL